MERVKVAEYAAMFWKGGDLIWDDYLHHRQFALTAESESILRWFSSWRILSSIGAPGEIQRAIADRLIDEKVLIREGSAEHYEETRLLDEWGSWGAGTRYHHFASRTDETVTYLDPASDHMAFADKAKSEPPPSPVKTFPERPITVTAPEVHDLSRWKRPALVDALFSRRSVRHYSRAAIPLDMLGTLVDIAAGPIDVIDNEETGSVVRKTSPSAGARSPIELYAHVNRVHGLQPAVYHYASARGGLERIRPAARPATLRRAVGDQPWLADAPVLLIYTAVLQRTRWRFESRRAYRDILLEAGHISQTVLLTATAMGLGSVTATALCDSVIEQILGVDPISEPLLAVTALGFPAT
ncbi:SagB family peptide dehydrogenase [Hoyosella altamirensis]|uniref:SagB-type dehydrogenase family enzyme n=1 Tax=Hoyosella altamirensis TaxID=616997 RepID=A0A839RJD0_9ACTN|nr:SagB family peptide dehydrogenase [Hoyosella altamirensis]MBB3036338.1 SagB-type dehydrogenase family enzyme [Hoyosella altamirensis]